MSEESFTLEAGDNPTKEAINPKQWQVEWLDPNSLTPYAKNARKNDQTVPYLINAIKRFGFKVPIVIDKEGTVVCGHTRLKAALQIGYTKVPCVKADDLTDAEIKAFRLADNKIQEMSEWDGDLLSTELDDLKLDFDEDMADFGFGSFDIDDDNGDRDNEDRGGSIKKRFGFVPFSILRATDGDWVNRKRAWIAMGIASEEGREKDLCYANITEKFAKYINK